MYNEIEYSNEGGRPLFLYEFELGNKIWRYTAADSAVSANGNLYTPVYITDDGVKQTGESQTDAFTVSLDFTLPVAQLFQTTPPITPITVRRLVKHDGDDEAVINYVGFVTQVNAGSTPGVAEIQCITLSPTMQRNGVRLTWSRNCPYALYDGSTCKVNKANYATRAVIESAGSGIIRAAAFAQRPDAWFSGGFIEWVDSYTGALERRGIDEHAGNEIRMLGKSDGLVAGLNVVAYPGCPRTSEACNSQFNNMANYGGYRHMPGTSPFSGDPIY